MTEELRREMQPHLESGLLKVILDVDQEGFTVFRLADTGYVAFLHDRLEAYQKYGTHIGCNLKGKEFDMLMHHPRRATLMQIINEASGKGEKRAVVLTEKFVEKFTELKNKVAAMEQNPYINFALEAELIEIANKALTAKKKWWQR